MLASERGGIIRRQLAAWNRESDADDIEDALQAACDQALRTGCPARTNGEAYKWLRTAAHRWLSNHRRDHAPEVLTDPADAEVFDTVPDGGPGPDTELLRTEAGRERAALAEALVADLSARQRDVLALHFRGLKRPQIAKRLRLSPRQVKRELEAIMDSARALVAELAGGGCPEGEPVVLRRACGLATPSESARARAHLTDCHRCGQLADRLDLWRDVPASLPLPAVVEHSRPGLLADAVGAARQHLADGVAQAKQHAASAYYRATDPTPLAGTRPGAAAAVIAGCVTIGTGTYCVENDVNPLRGFGIFPPAVAEQPEPREREQPVRVKAPAPEPVVETAPPTTVPAPVEPEPTAEPAPAPAPEPEPEPSAPAPVPQSGGDSLSGLSGNPEPAPAPAPAPVPPATGTGGSTGGTGGGGSAGTTFGGL